MQDEFDFLYAKYPRKVGKTVGRKRFETLRKKGVSLRDLEQSLKNYTSMIAGERRSMQYVLYFSTWIANYEDYLEVEAAETNQSLAEAVIMGEV